MLDTRDGLWSSEEEGRAELACGDREDLPARTVLRVTVTLRRVRVAGDVHKDSDRERRQDTPAGTDFISTIVNVRMDVEPLLLLPQSPWRCGGSQSSLQETKQA